jgi:hypothetical protein
MLHAPAWQINYKRVERIWQRGILWFFPWKGYRGGGFTYCRIHGAKYSGAEQQNPCPKNTNLEFSAFGTTRGPHRPYERW